MAVVGQVFRGTVPFRTGDRFLLFRILQTKRTVIEIRLTNMPGEPPIHWAHRVVWIDTDDINMMVSSGLVEPILELPCPTCKRSMHLWNGLKGNQQVVLFACEACTTTFEV